MDSVEQEFTCICGKQKGWITEGKTTSPCPSCGRCYVGKYNRWTYRIGAVLIDQLKIESIESEELLQLKKKSKSKFKSKWKTVLKNIFYYACAAAIIILFGYIIAYTAILFVG